MCQQAPGDGVRTLVQVAIGQRPVFVEQRRRVAAYSCVLFDDPVNRYRFHPSWTAASERPHSTDVLDRRYRQRNSVMASENGTIVHTPSSSNSPEISPTVAPSSTTA